ncbi:YqgE/AlgH family protein [Chitinophaga tropicalis]|uniref:YqgE/AlgH family protein n=1 Tax=Chitinophaga tropicalis TaxID=2683588 RepID=A0A7K1U476_9BACT|nr:YqgE/AlgH family protein [Chitinophaga tropicalis]MVT09096.1 YqgE/AlgH family protein [Chitinophaga tropicalis]
MNAGNFLNSTSLLEETFFENAVIFITEYNEKGAMGFVVNKEFPRKLNELEEFKNIKPFSLYEGGPVDQEHLYFVHRRPDLITGGTPVTDNILLGGDFKAAVYYINNGTLTEKDIKIFIGYCGWDYEELDEEVAEGSWQVRETGTVF